MRQRQMIFGHLPLLFLIRWACGVPASPYIAIHITLADPVFVDVDKAEL